MQALDIDFKQVSELGDDLTVKVNALRDAHPIYWSEIQQAWIVSGHEENIEALKGDLPLSVNRLGRMYTYMPEAEERERRIPYVMATFQRMLLSMDPPEQTRMRRLMMKAFTRGVSEYYRPYARQVIAEALDEAERAGEFDFIEVVAKRVPSRVIVRLMGLDESYVPKLRHWAVATMRGTGGGGTTKEMLDETEKVFLEMREAFMAEIDKRRADPGEDFISALMTSGTEGDRLDDEEIVAACIMSLIAGHDTTGNTIGLGAMRLARDPNAWRELRDIAPDDLMNAIMELQRITGMSTTQTRVVIRDFEWRGHQIKAGQLVFIMLLGANRDPEVFEQPEKMDFHRSPENSVVFGPGLHHCIGHLLAKMQLTELFPALVERFDGLEILDDRLDWATVLGFRGLNSLRVRALPRTR